MKKAKTFIIQWYEDLLKCKDFVPKNKEIEINKETYFVLGYFPYETASLINYPVAMRRDLFHEMEFQLSKINAYDNKYVVVIRDRDNTSAYFFHDNSVYVGRIEHITGYAARDLKLK